MAGNQFGFDSSLDNLDNLLNIVNNKLDDYFGVYNITSDAVLYVELRFTQMDNKLLSEFSLETPCHISKQENIITTKDLNIPISINKDSLGNKLLVESDNGFITNISYLKKDKIVNFLDIIKGKAKFLRTNHKDNITRFDSDFKFYSLKDSKNIDYILAIKILKNNFVEKIRYSLDGVVINHVTDNIVDGFLVRTIGDKQIVFKNDKIVSSKQIIKLKAISKPKYKPLFTENKNIGVIDTETYLAKDSIRIIYALGFKTNLAKDAITYYIDKKTLDSNDIVLTMVNELLRPKYSNVTFYCDNFGGYDSVFILKVLYEYNDNYPYKKYKIDCILRDSKIIKVKISRDGNSLTILDSYPMLSDKLITLGENFEVATLKSKFPYKFLIQDNLFYEGNTPSIDYYEDITKDEYNALNIGHWCLYNETIKYLTNDLYSLYEVITKASKQIFRDYLIDMTSNNTISGLAVNIFLNNFDKNNIPMINKPNIYKDIKQAYYGGITEVYKPYGENLFYYDVNSLYPYVGQDMPGLECSKILYYKQIENIDNLFGFYYCSVETPLNNYLGLLPLRTKSGISFPIGKWFGWYFSEELKFAKNNGYKIKVLKGYNFNREVDVFKDYINKVYGIKSNPSNNSQKAVAKSLLNNLLGRFGINLEKPVNEVLSKKAFESKMAMYKIMSYQPISEDKYLVSYIPKLDYDIITSHNLDFLKVLNKFKDKELQGFNVTSIPISAAVTAYARIHISQLKLDIMKGGGKIYYSDTDSIVTNKELSPSMVSSKEIGKLKLEHELEKGIFITGKTYWIRDHSGKSFNRAKGIKPNSLSYSDYLKLLNNTSVNTAVKSSSKINWQKGHVLISTKKDVTINSDSYLKRDKKYDFSGNWIDTKPVYINDIDKSLVVYENTNTHENVREDLTKKTLLQSQDYVWWMLLVACMLLYVISKMFDDSENTFSEPGMDNESVIFTKDINSDSEREKAKTEDIPVLIKVDDEPISNLDFEELPVLVPYSVPQ